MKYVLKKKEANVLLIIGIGFLAVWLLGLGGSHMLGGFIYVALLLGLLCVAVSLVTRFRGRV
jgi:hypothetical protein